MRIAIPIVSFTKSGGARVLSELANAWIRGGHSVCFWVADRDSVPYFPTCADIKYPAIARGGHILRQLYDLRRIVKDDVANVDVVLANHHLTAWVAWLSGACVRKKVFYYSQAYEADYYADRVSSVRGRVLGWLAKESFSLFDRVVVNSPIYFDYPGVHAIEWIPPGIDFSIFYPRPSREASGFEVGKSLVVGCIGRPEVWKGTFDVLEAIRVCKKRDARILLRVAYFIPEGFSDLDGCVELIVPKNDRDLADFYRSCDVVVAPGHVQLGAPHYPVMEAMACGVPVVSTGYLPASGNNSYLVPVKDCHEIARVLIEIISDYERALRLSRSALQDVSVYSWDAVSNKFLSVFRDYGVCRDLM